MKRPLLISVAALLVLGWISPATAAKARPAWVIPETLNVRSGPGTDRDLIGIVTKGAKLYVTAFANNWCWAKLPSGKWGWVAEWHLQFSYDKGRELAEDTGGTGSTGSTCRTGCHARVDKRGGRQRPQRPGHRLREARQAEQG